MPREDIKTALAARQLTVKDVARLSGTSPSTVSRVLTGRVPVAKAKRDAVMSAISELNYRPNLLARSLKTKSTHSIGLLINDILNPFYGALARGVEDAASEAGYAVIFCNTNEDPDREGNYLQMLQDKGIDGVVLAPTGGNRQAMEELLSGGIALVQVDRQIPGLAAGSVTLDNEAGSEAATRHLMARGHRRIGLVTYAMGQSTIVAREAGYRKALREGACAGDEDICRVKFDLSDTGRQVSRMLRGEAPPTALLLANNRIALSALRTIKDLQLAIPADLAVVVFDDLEVFALTTPSITAIAQPAYAMGRKAAEFLLQQLGGEKQTLRQTAVFQPELIVRESSQRCLPGPGASPTE